ncbi:putative OB-fold protein [Catenulispora sp. EB89]|uniref:Zn-ribbon domain-containing OB-fold protein n=1 Tax=Catenulispora sp. EB89 TaxID=3156257 RepID=UPI00351256CB
MTDGIPAAPGTDAWFREGPEGFALLAGRCTTCGALSFPPRTVPGCPDPDCAGLEQSPEPLSTHGTLWSYTDARYAPPPPYPRPPDTEFSPYALAAVELTAERMIVLGQVSPDIATESLRVGMTMELVPGTLVSSAGVEEKVWNWRPIGPSEESIADSAAYDAYLGEAHA